MALIVMLWVGIFLKYSDDLRSDLREAVRTNENFSMVFEENVLRSIGEIDKALLYLRRTIETRKDTTDFHTIVSTTDVLSEIIVQVAIIDASGIMRASNAGPQPAAPLDLSDREHYRVHLSSGEDRLFVSKPVVGRVSRQWSVQFTRRFLNSDGSFGGVVVASLKPEHLTNFYNKIDFASSVSIALVGNDGIVRSAGGSAGGFALGEDLNGTRFVSIARSAGMVTFEETDSASGNRRLVTFRHVRGQPLWMSVSTDLRAVYAGSAANLRLNAIVGFVLTVLILIAVKNILQAEAKARQKAEQLHLTLENMSQGIMLITKDLEIPIINAKCGELLDLPPKFIETPPRFDELMAYQARNSALQHAGEHASLNPLEGSQPWSPAPHCAISERLMANGTVIEIRSAPLPDGGLVQTFTDITKRREAETHVARLASEDPLTDLPNRRIFRARLEEICSAYAAQCDDPEAPGFAVLFLDLDRFKVINDTLGHRIGDLLLRRVGNRLKQAVEPGVLLARLGGDEFSILVPMAGSRAEIGDLARRLLDCIAPPFDVDGYKVRTGASIGIAMGPADGRNVDDLLVAADLALYSVKADSRGTFRFYSHAMSTELNDRREIETDLRTAIERGELELHYQPIIDLRDDCVAGFEALARWRHPVKGLIPPGLFIPVAEDTGLIMPIGEWALDAACREAARWPGNLKIAVNLSPVQLLAPDLGERIEHLLAETGLAPCRLEIEITEQIVLEDNENTIATLRRLKNLGVRIAMDDFGTGYSSLSYLRTFPFDKVKIDRSFVTDLVHGTDRVVIVQAVVSIARALGMTTTAEGVESDYQCEFLAALGCDEAQGFLFSGAVPADEIAGIIEKWGLSKAAGG
ncbi:bifunctional diguanylate cyclase/phosphodiesterase [Blastochloris sulfoviridis]|uniref:bifunctional diguanylate cyclase/phosphodiesterase n=1 Tax=Blastochloris sulfoviridis TaxID=50712 RepID=UPI001FE339D6|nr:EAL domain-containing protein [Blastochloris sulfoviridis]